MTVRRMDGIRKLKFSHVIRDYDPEESVTEKMRRFGEVKSTKGLRVLMKEIALTASAGKEQHDFLGWIKIPLKVTLLNSCGIFSHYVDLMIMFLF